MRWMREHKLISALILVLFLLLLIFAASVTAGGRFAHVTAPVNSGVSRISGFFSSAGSAIRDNVKGIFSYRSLQQQVEALEDENAELTRQLAEEKLTQQQLDELQELAALLNYDYTKQEFNIVTGDVISLDGSNWTNIFTINCGTESGIKVGDAVVNGTITLAGTPISVADKCEVFVISADGKTISATNVNAIQKDDNDKVWYKTNSDGEVTTIVIQTVDAAGSAGSSSEETYEWEVNANTLRVNLTYSSNTTSVSDVDVMNNAGYALQQAGYVVNEWGGSYTQSLTATLTSSGLTAHAYKGNLDITFTIFMAKATA